jgi:hypothetical protein
MTASLLHIICSFSAANSRTYKAILSLRPSALLGELHGFEFITPLWFGVAPAGPLFVVLLGAAALGASLVFSTAAFFILVPLTVATLAVTFGLSAGAFVIKGILFSAVNLVSLPSCMIFLHA